MKKNISLIILSVIFGGISSLPLAYPGLSYFSFIALIPFFYFLGKEEKIARILSVSIFFNVSCILVKLYFVMFEISVLLPVVLLAVVFGIIVYFFKKKFGRSFFWLFVPVLYLIFEYLEIKLQLVPINFFISGNALASTFFLPLARFYGSYGLSAIMVLFNGLFAYALIDIKNKKKLYFVSFIIIVLLVNLSTFSFFMKNEAKVNLDEKSILKIATISFNETIIYDNAGGKIKERFKEELREKIKSEIAGQSDYVFLPSSLFGTIDVDVKNDYAFTKFGIANNGPIISYLSNMAKESAIGVLSGMRTIEQGKNYNSIVYFDKNGNLAGVYHKHDLVVGSEHWPYAWTPFYWRWTRKVDINGKVETNNITPSENPHSLLKLENFDLGVAYCSEAQNKDLFLLAKDKNASLVFAPVNNDWTRSVKISRYSQLYLNLLKINSVYGQIPVIVNGKNNYSGIIYPDGTSNLVFEDIDAFGGNLEDNQIRYVVNQFEVSY